MRHLVCLIAVLGIGIDTLAQDPSTGQASGQGTSLSDMMSSAMTATEPLPEHDLIRSLAGEWRYVIEMTMPGAPVMRGAGTTSVMEIMGGRFMELRSKSSEKDGFENLMLMGYDSRKGKQQYFMLGVDSLGHYYVDLHGSWNPDSAALILTGTEHDPATGVDIDYRQVFRFPGRDVMTCEVFMDMPGSAEFVRVAGLVYQRVEGSGQAAPAVVAKNTTTTAPVAAAPAGRAPVTADEIEAMDRSELLDALTSIARARTMPELEAASRARLDDQFRATLARLKASQRPYRPISSPEGKTAASLPGYGDEMIRNMSRSEARAALNEILTARRIPDLDDSQKAVLKTTFDKIMKQLRAKSGEGVAQAILDSAAKESAASEVDRGRTTTPAKQGD